jgi:threonine/homoserine/homoserine lactone efflux protein
MAVAGTREAKDRRMTIGSLLLMAFVGLVALVIGIGLEVTARTRRREASRYVSRLSGVMFCAVGLILIVFAASWRMMT